MAQSEDTVLRRIVCEYGRLYAYLYITDDRGKVLDDEAFKQPFRLDLKDVRDESGEAYQVMYQHLQDTILYFTTARDDDESAKSDEKE